MMNLMITGVRFFAIIFRDSTRGKCTARANRDRTHRAVRSRLKCRGQCYFVCRHDECCSKRLSTEECERIEENRSSSSASRQRCEFIPKIDVSPGCALIR